MSSCECKFNSRFNRKTRHFFKCSQWVRAIVNYEDRSTTRTRIIAHAPPRCMLDQYAIILFLNAHVSRIFASSGLSQRMTDFVRNTNIRNDRRVNIKMYKKFRHVTKFRTHARHFRHKENKRWKKSGCSIGKSTKFERVKVYVVISSRFDLHYVIATVENLQFANDSE